MGRRGASSVAKVYPSRAAGTQNAKMALLADPTDLPSRSWWQILKRTVKEFQDDELTDWAASLTYYAVMSLFPMLIALVALLGLVGQEHSVITLLDSFRQA